MCSKRRAWPWPASGLKALGLGPTRAGRRGSAGRRVERHRPEVRAPARGARGPRGLRGTRAVLAGRPPGSREGRGQGDLRRGARAHRRGGAAHRQAGRGGARDLREGRSRLREPVPPRRSRRGLRRDPLELARADGPLRDERGQARVRRGARGHHPRGLLEARRHLGADPPPLRDARELLLRLQRAAGPQPGARGRAGRADPRRGRLPPRPPEAPVRGQGRGALATGRALRPGRQHLPDPRARAGRELPGHQPRRPVRADRVHELARAEPQRVSRGERAQDQPQAGRDLSLRGHEHEPHPDRQGPHRDAPARRGDALDPTAASTTSQAPRVLSATTRRASSRTARPSTNGAPSSP